MVQPTAGKQVQIRDLTILGGIVFVFSILGFAIAQFSGSVKTSQLPPVQSKGPERAPGPVVQLEPFTISLLGDETTTLLRVKLLLELDDWKTVALIRQHLAPVQFTASSILAEQTHASIRSPEGKQLLRTRLYESLNNTLPNGGVKAVYFRELLYE
jgi:flagellar basal body-associated protein FliL